MKTTSKYIHLAMKVGVSWLSAAAVASSISFADTALDAKIVDFGNDIPTEAELVSALKPVKTRSLGKSKPGSAVLRLHFDVNSAEVTPKGRRLLNSLGAAMQNSDLMTFRFVLEGHTDASGTEQYNEKLSQRRADAVKNYLVNVYDISDERLISEGRGEVQLANSAEPNSRENRRVQVTTILE